MKYKPYANGTRPQKLLGVFFFEIQRHITANLVLAISVLTFYGIPSMHDIQTTINNIDTIHCIDVLVLNYIDRWFPHY